MVTVAVAVSFSRLLNPFMVTVAGVGTWAGAVYRPSFVIRPTLSSPHIRLFTCQESMVTVDVNCWVCPMLIVAVAGEIAI
jgi:hypothetical protein